MYKHQRRRRKCINQTIKQADRVLTAGPINASGNCPHTLSIYYTCPTWPGLHVMLDLMEATPSFILTKWEKALEISLVGALQVFILKTETHLLTPGLFIISLHNRPSGGSNRLALQEGVSWAELFQITFLVAEHQLQLISRRDINPPRIAMGTGQTAWGLYWAIMKTRWNHHLKAVCSFNGNFINFCMNHFVPCQSCLAVKEPFERSEQRALVGHSTFLGTTYSIFFWGGTACCSLLFWTLLGNVRTTPCARGSNGLLCKIPQAFNRCTASFKAF